MKDCWTTQIIKRSVLILIICLGMAAGLVGCSSKEKSNTQDKSKVTPTITPLAQDVPAATVPEEKSKLKVTLSKESGSYDGEFDLEIACDGEADIYYTTDGSNPITSATRILYGSPIPVTDRSGDSNYVSAVNPFLFDAANVKVNSTNDGFLQIFDTTPSNEQVDKCTVIRAVALDQKKLYTKVETNTYFVGSIADHIQGIKESCEAAGTSLAVMSISINYDDMFDPEKGIYVKGNIYEQAIKDFLASGDKLIADTSRRIEANYNQRGKEWERNIHIDYFESDGTTTTCELQQDCGIRIQGNYSRSDLQKGFRLYAGKDYGTKNFDYAFFGDDLKNDAGETISKFKTLTLRNGGNCAFSAKYSDTYWQSLIADMDCDTQTSRPCVVYIDGEYWGLYVLQEDYSQEYFEETHGVDADDVVAYKGDAEKYDPPYKLDLGKLPDGETNESYYFNDLMNFFQTHTDLSKDADYAEFSKLVDVESARDYFATEIWINNKWDWPGKNWSLWKTVKVDDSNPYADGRWRFIFYDMEFGGVSGAGDAVANTIKEDNYNEFGLLDRDTDNPAVLIYVYLMTNESFREEFANSLLALSDNNFQRDAALAALDQFKNTYGPLYDQFFARYPGTGSKENAINGSYASYKSISDFLSLRADHIQPMLDFVKEHYSTK
jgi:hypothetical protein